MAEDQESQEEKLARRQMAEALELFEKKPDQGIEAMRNLLEVYPDFMEARQWLADYYEEADETRLAVSQYEQMLRIEPENDEVWEGLERVDPPTAKRLRRFRNVAPDPFLSGSEAEGAADLDDFENEDEEFQQAAEEPSGQFSGAETSDDIFLEDEGDDYDYEPLAWAHEEDPEYRDQLDKNSAFVDVLDGFMLFWDDPQGWSHLLGECRAPADAGWNELEAMVPAAAGSLDTGPPTVLVSPEHTPVVLALPLTNPTVVVGETLQMALEAQELLFALGVGIHGLLNENAEYVWAAEHVIERDAELSELRMRVLRGASDFTMGWDQAMPREQIRRLAKVCHAWELRAVLSADRAGLLACGSADAACRAIAALVGDPGDAATVSVDGFLQQFEDVPPGELAAAGLGQDPWTDPEYAAYRIQMIRWWATTDEFKSLA